MAKPATPPSIEDATDLLPGVVADSVIQELAAWLAANPSQMIPHLAGFADPAAEIRRVIERLDTERDALSGALAARAEATFANSPAFAKKLRGHDGRDTLWSFTRHWLCGTLAETHGALVRALPHGYASGAALPRAA